MSKEIRKIKTTPITANESMERASFKMFKFLFPLPKENENGVLSFDHLSEIEMKYKTLTFNAKLLYILLKNKYLMLTNNGKSLPNDSGIYTDELGDIYLEYTTKRFIEVTGIKDPKTIRSAKEKLKEAQLLQEVVTTGKQANRFYLLRPQIQNKSLKYNINDSEGLDTYYELPQYLFEHEAFKDMPLSAKFAYAILKERYLYSVKNKSENFIDDNGNIYCVYTNQKLASTIGYNYSKPIPKIKNDLIKTGLLTEEKITGEASRIYVNTPKNLYDIESKKTQKSTESKKKTRGELSLWLGGNYHSGRGELSLSIDTPYLYAFYQHSLLNNHNSEIQNSNSKPSSGRFNKNDKNKNLLNQVQNEFNIKITNQYKKTLINLFDQLDTDIIEYAIEYTSLNATSPKQYLVRILENWIEASIKTVEQAKAFKQVTKNNQKLESKEMTPQWLLDREHEKNDDKDSKHEENENLDAERKAFLQHLKDRWGEDD
jgi:DnaD/phage-associated family protein